MWRCNTLSGMILRVLMTWITAEIDCHFSRYVWESGSSFHLLFIWAQKDAIVKRKCRLLKFTEGYFLLLQPCGPSEPTLSGT